MVVKTQLVVILTKIKNRIRIAKASYFFKKYVRLRYAALALVVFFLIGIFYLFLLLKDLPSAELLTDRQVLESTRIYDRTGQVLLYEIHGEEKRTVIPFEEIPDYVKKATISIEDENFYSHPAFDWKAIARAFAVNLLRGHISQGGSTITQQLAKNAFLTPDRTFTRKIKELALAFKLEKKFTKDQILNLYLNQIPYGSNAYGIEAAAKTYFGKNAKDLSLAESALLASLPRAPSYYSPFGSHTKELLARKNVALEKMFKHGFIDEKQKVSAQKEELTFAPHFTEIKAPHFALMVQDYLNNKYGEDFVQTSGLKVLTTLDWNLQQSAEKAVADGADRNKTLYDGHNAALVAQDANTGQVLALVGSKDYFGTLEPDNCKVGDNCKFEGNFNVATQGLRQPGSSIKPFAYVTAFKKGYTPDSVVFDVPTEFAYDNSDCPLTVDFTKDNDPNADNSDKGCFHPQNFDEKFRGPVTLKSALAQSINVPAVKTLYLAGMDNVLKTAHEFGITTLTERSRYGLSLVLGGGEVKLIDMVEAYSVLAQEGVKHNQSFILKITDNKGQTLEEYNDQPEPVIDPQYPRLIDDILSDPDNRAPLFQNSLALTVFPNQQVALKTGTTNDYHDAWAMGYTKSLVVGVWAGNNDNTPMQKHGSSILAAVPIWSAFMGEALKNRPTDTFTKPDPIFVDKPVLNGQYVVNYWSGGQKYPQVHDILYYVNKNDPQGPQPANPENDSQFQNWEEPVLTWVKANLPGFDQTYNQPVPIGSKPDATDSNLSLDIPSPANGSFIKGPVTLAANIKSAVSIKRLEVFFNNNLVDQLTGIGTSYNYSKSFQFGNAELQNILKVTITDGAGNKIERQIILYK